MSHRHEILDDKDFWLKLEFEVCGWFRTCGDDSLGGFWCDGFLPENARSTREGIDVKGTAWVAEGQKAQHKCTFTASIPQRMLSRRRSALVFDDLTLDIARKELRFSVRPAGKSPNTLLERTRGR